MHCCKACIRGGKKKMNGGVKERMEKRAHGGWRRWWWWWPWWWRGSRWADGWEGGCGRESRVTSRVRRGRRKPRSGYKVGEFDNAKGIAHVGGRKRERGGTVVGCSLVYKTFKRLFLFRCDSMHSIAKTCLPGCPDACCCPPTLLSYLLPSR